VCLQGAGDGPLERGQNGMEDRADTSGVRPVKLSSVSSKRQYNWNTTHFYPDVHKLNNHDDELSSILCRQRRHSEPRCFLRAGVTADTVSNDQQQAYSSGSSSSLASFDEVKVIHTPSMMPVSQLTVQLAAPHTGPIAKVDLDLDSSSQSEDDDAPKTWHRSPLHFRRGRRLGAAERSGKKTAADVSTTKAVGDAGDLWKRAANRPTMRFKEQAEKRRRFLQQRCQMYGWDLTADEEQRSAVVGNVEEGRQNAVASQSLSEDFCFIDHSSNDSLVVNQESTENGAVNSVAAKDRVRQIEANGMINDPGRLGHVSSINVPFMQSMSVSTPGKESSSFENIYDMVSLEPDKSSNEVLQFFEPHQARVDAAVYSHSKPLMSNKLPRADIHSAAGSDSYKPVVRSLNISNVASVANTSVNAVPCSIITSRPSSAPSKSTQKTSLDAKSIVEQEKLNFIEYKIDYRRQQSSGNESGSGRSDGEKDLRRQPEPTNRAIPPDDYEYILRKIHYNRPTNKADQTPAARTKQGSELHIEIKKPQTVTRHITVDVAKPSVPQRVESLQHTGLRQQFPARPDVIPSPNYDPSSLSMITGDPSDGGMYPNISLNKPQRTVLCRNNPSVSTELSPLPIAAGGSTVFEWESRVRTPDSCNKSQYARATSTNSKNTTPGRKPPKPPREELSLKRNPDFWNYNSTYEPGSPPPQSQPGSLANKKQELWQQTSKAEFKDMEKMSDRDLVGGLVRGLDENAELNLEAASVFREQYRWSIHEPCRSVEPDQLKHSQTSPLPRSQVFASSVCMPSKPVQLVSQVSQPPLSKDSSGVHSHKEKVFSLTGYHRPPQQQKTDSPSQHLYLKDNFMHPSYSGVRDSYNNSSVMEPEPLYWYSEADKRKPIISSPEIETVLNRDRQDGYFYRSSSSQRLDNQNITREHSRRHGGDVDAGWKHGLFYRDDFAECDVRRNVRLQGQKSQDRLVQQMSLGSQELAGGHLDSSSHVASFPTSSLHSIHPRAQSDHVEIKKSSASRTSTEPSTEVNQHEAKQPTKSSSVVSRASADYEQHIRCGQENYRSQVMARIEPSSNSAGYSAQDRSLTGKSCHNVPSIFASHDVTKGYSTGRGDSSKIVVSKLDTRIPSVGSAHKVHEKKISDAFPTNRGKCEIYADDDSRLSRVAEIKAKLFGRNEDGARKLFQQRTGDSEQIQYSTSTQKKRYDDLTELETLLEKLNRDTGENHSQQCNVTNIQHGLCTDDSAVKRLSVSNIKVLDSNSRGKQSPSLEYAKAWLIGERRASAPVNTSGKLSSSEQVQWSSAGDVPPPENAGRFMSHRSMKSMPVSCTEAGDACRPVGSRYVSSSSTNEVKVSQSGSAWTSNPPAGSVVFRSHPSGQMSSTHSNFSSSFARRSLPALTEKDAERWQNMVARIQENESRKQAAAKSRSVEQLMSQSPEHISSSTVIHQRPARIPAVTSEIAERNLAMNAPQPLLHSSLDIMRPADPVKPKRQQTPRDVKCRDDCRMRAVHRPSINTDSGYLDSGSDSHGSSGADVPKRPLSESIGSDEVELQRHTCDEDDDVKLSGTSLLLTNADSGPSSADRSNRLNVSVSEYNMSSPESQESRIRQLQKLREDWFGKNIIPLQQSHSSSLSLDKSNSLCTHKPDILRKDVGYKHSDPPELERSVPSISVGLPQEKSAKPLYVSPLVQTSSCGIYRSPLSRCGDDHSGASTVSSTQLPSSSKISSFKMVLPSHGHGQNTSNRDKPTVQTPRSSKVTHIPVRAVGRQAGLSPTRHSAFVPYVEHRDSQISRMGTGGANIVETKKESVNIEPTQFEASRLLEKTVDQPSAKTFQRQSELFKHQTQELMEPHVKITRLVTNSKVERTYRMENHLQPRAAARNEVDKGEASDGEMTDATDITLDVMVGANQSLTPLVDAVDFSDVEFLSSANLPPKYDASFMKGGARLCLPHPLADARRICLADDGSSGDSAAVAAAKAEMELCRKIKIDSKTEEGEDAPVERRRSIKELVHSFEDMMTPFMRARPRSMEIRISSSSSEEEEGKQDDSDVVRRKRKNVTLRASSSFKEATRLDRKTRQQSTVNH